MDPMKLLITAFEPFGGEDTNASLETMKALPETEGVTVRRITVPVVFRDCAECVLDAVKDFQPDALIMLGQAGGRAHVTPELTAHNEDDARIPDNREDRPVKRKIIPDGPDTIRTKLPAEEIARRMRTKGVPACVSEDAGRFVCNHLMYEVLCALEREGIGIPAGFIHLPYLEEQNRTAQPCVTKKEAADALSTAVEVLYEGWKK
ncbi:MAG: pyroglutamyl-peptidase I [Clostridia bacterium]|nr:pyroglutamyl-peptidase I [Clostridia bacterium]